MLLKDAGLIVNPEKVEWFETLVIITGILCDFKNKTLGFTDEKWDEFYELSAKFLSATDRPVSASAESILSFIGKAHHIAQLFPNAKPFACQLSTLL